jgi:hypothetical protein
MHAVLDTETGRLLVIGDGRVTVRSYAAGPAMANDVLEENEALLTLEPWEPEGTHLLRVGLVAELEAEIAR